MIPTLSDLYNHFVSKCMTINFEWPNPTFIQFIQFTDVWNDQILTMMEGDTMTFARPAVFVEINKTISSNGTFNKIGYDCELILHLVINSININKIQWIKFYEYFQKVAKNYIQFPSTFQEVGTLYGGEFVQDFKYKTLYKGELKYKFNWWDYINSNLPTYVNVPTEIITQIPNQ